jgi:stage II sporulation protein D
MLTGRQLRQRLGLKSTMVSFSLFQGDSGNAVELMDPSHKVLQSPPQLIGLWRDSATGISGASNSVSENRAVGAAPLPPPPITQRYLTGRAPQALNGSIVLEAKGQGYGHGVGMSQWGAHGLASNGADFQEILLHYYRGATIRPYRPADDPSVASSTRSEPALMG